MKKAVLVGNLPSSFTDDDLSKLFAPFGKLSDFRIEEDCFTGQSQGFGFVAFTSSEAAEKATELHGTTRYGKELRVVLCNEAEYAVRDLR